jgi:serine/threonine protein kinase
VRYGPQPPARVIQILAQACSSLAEAHEAGLLHRDIKPPNLFVSRAADEIDIVKLLDFGIVHSADDTIERQTAAISLDDSLQTKLTQVGAMLGTPGFMAPEQILGMEMDGRADLYALGCVAWWLLTGKEVFKRVEGAEAKILHKHLHDPVPLLREVMRGWCPVELEIAIGMCLSKDAAQRPANARAISPSARAIERRARGCTSALRRLMSRSRAVGVRSVPSDRAAVPRTAQNLSFSSAVISAASAAGPPRLASAMAAAARSIASVAPASSAIHTGSGLSIVRAARSTRPGSKIACVGSPSSLR